LENSIEIKFGFQNARAAENETQTKRNEVKHNRKKTIQFDTSNFECPISLTN